MSLLVHRAGRFTLGAFVVLALAFGTVEVVKGSGETLTTCPGCLLEPDPHMYCSGPQCCDADGSICLGPSPGDCLCA